MRHQEGEVIVLCPAAVPSCARCWASPSAVLVLSQELCSGIVAMRGRVWGAFPALPLPALRVTLVRSLQSASTGFSFCFDLTVNRRGEDLCVLCTLPCAWHSMSACSPQGKAVLPGKSQCHRPAARHQCHTDNACARAAKHCRICHGVRSR